MNITGRTAVALVVCLAAPFLAGAAGGVATSASVDSWYPTLVKPSFNPPSWLFGPVWSALYLLMGVSSWLVWRAGGPGARSALAAYCVQLALNLLWSVLFFGLRLPGVALVEIALLWAAIVVTIVQFRRVRPIAAWLLAPYLLWTTFAVALNAALWWLNRG